MLFIADFFVEDVAGGGELCSQEILQHLQKSQSKKIVKKHSHTVTQIDIKNHSGDMILVSNFVNLSESIKMTLASGYDYCIIEHDWKMFRSRNPLTYEKMIAPEEELINATFFRKAKAVLCQSRSHAEIIQKNLWSDNIVNLGCNLWSDKDLDSLEKKIGRVKTRECGIMDSPNKIKGTKEATFLCRTKGINYVLIPQSEQELFWDELSVTNKVVFLPQSFETYSRFAIEAKILGCKMITNKAIGAMSEDYYDLNGIELLNEIRKRKQVVLDRIKTLVEKRTIDFIKPLEKPSVSLITTVYKGSQFMTGFLDAFVKQTYCGALELIVVDVSPDDEHEIAKPYLEMCRNIRYVKLADKKTTMECFNIATDMANGEFIALCMIDDVISPHFIDTLSKHLYLDSSVDLVYGDTMVVDKPNEKWEKHTSTTKFDHSVPSFSKENMIKNLPGCMPMYRKSMHYKVGGYKPEILHGGDWEIYLNAVRHGAVFKKINKPVGLYYVNPNGLSTTSDTETTKVRRNQERKIFEEYKDVFGEKVYKEFKPYFDQFQ